MKTIILTTALCLFATPVIAGRYNDVLKIGDPAPEWTDLPGTDDAKHSSADLSDRQAVVVFFTCNTCPYANDAEARVLALSKKYSDRGLAVVAINVDKHEDEVLMAMKERAQQQELTFPYLYDESQQIARDFGAKYTPEFFVLNAQRQVVYMGAFDDSPMGTEVQERYVESAVEAALAGETPQKTETAPVGCAIRYERVRRSR
jgi:peroxiredoxin